MGMPEGAIWPFPKKVINRNFNMSQYTLELL